MFKYFSVHNSAFSMQGCSNIFSKLIASLLFQLVFAGAYCQSSSSGMGFTPNSDQTSDVYGLGVTYGGGLGAPFISYDLLPNYTGGTSIGGMATYEHLFSAKLGLGLAFSYSKASYTAVINYPAGAANPAGTLTDTKKGGYMGLGGRCIYHITGFNRFEPYIGAVSGITITDLYSNTNSPGNQNAATNRTLFGGILIGVLAGIEYHVNNYFSVRLECNYSGVPNYLGGITVTYRVFDRF